MTDTLMYTAQSNSLYTTYDYPTFDNFTYPAPRQSAPRYIPMEAVHRSLTFSDQRKAKPALPSPGTEHVKHRRTRSGCYTCRARRVKCDEKRPICDRCAKGGRQCSFPDPNAPKQSPATGAMKKKKKAATTNNSSVSLHDDVSSPDRFQLEGEFENDQHEYDCFDTNFLHPQDYFDLRSLSAPSSVQSDTLEEQFMVRTTSQVSSAYGSVHSDQSHLDRDVSFFLKFYKSSINSHHYLLNINFESDDTLQTLVLQLSTQNKALLYSTVAFSSFHYHIEKASQQYDNFLEYYDGSLSLLRSAFENSATPDLAMLLTILQLATLEQYMGDWTSLQSHREAAKTIMTSIFSSESVISYEYSAVLAWFTSLDLRVAMISGTSTTLPEEWYAADLRNSRDQLALDPDNEYWIIKTADSLSRNINMQVANLLELRSIGDYGYATFAHVANELLIEIDNFWREIIPMLPTSAIVSGLAQLDGASTTATHLYTGDFWPINYIFADIHSAALVLQHHLSLSRGYSADFNYGHAAEICKIVAAVESYPHRPAGYLLPFNMALMSAAIWMPESTYRNWFRTQFQEMEDFGYIYSMSFRDQLANFWSEPVFFNSSISSRGSAITIALRILAEQRQQDSLEYLASDDSSLIRNLFAFVDLQN